MTPNTVSVPYTKSSEKEIKTAIKRCKDLGKLKKVIELLATKNPLPIKYKDHRLIGNFVGRRECHIEPDWLLSAVNSAISFKKKI